MRRAICRLVRRLFVICERDDGLVVLAVLSFAPMLACVGRCAYPVVGEARSGRGRFALFTPQAYQR